MLSDKQWERILELGLPAVLLAVFLLFLYKKGWPMLAGYIRTMEERSTKRDQDLSEERKRDSQFLREAVIREREISERHIVKNEALIDEFQIVVSKISNRLDDIGDSLRILSKKDTSRK